MGERVVKLSRTEVMVGQAMKKSVLSFGQCTGYVSTDYTEFKKYREELAAKGKKASMSAYFAKAMAIAMADYPNLNCVLTSEKEITVYDEVNVGVAVDTPAGILVVVVKDCANKSVYEISDELKVLVEKARNGGLTMEDMTGGTITLSNLSMLKEEFFTSIVVGDQAMIIGFGGIRKKPYVVDDEIKIRDIGNIMVNMNHSAAMGYPTSMYLCRVSDIIEDPRTYFPE